MRAKMLIALGIAVLTFSRAQADDSVLKLGTEGVYPPFNQLTNDGKLEGFDIDIGNAICEQMKVKCEWVTQDWDGIIPALLAGKFDAIVASMRITPERAEKVDFTNKYYEVSPAFAVPKDSDLKGITKQDLTGKTVGVAAGTTHYNYLTHSDTGATIKTYPSSPEEQLDLANGRIDVVMDDIVSLLPWLASPEGECCKILTKLDPLPREFFGTGMGIAVRKGNQELADKFNVAIAEIRRNGTYKKINEKYFDFDLYGSNP